MERLVDMGLVYEEGDRYCLAHLGYWVFQLGSMPLLPYTSTLFDGGGCFLGPEFVLPAMLAYPFQVMWLSALPPTIKSMHNADPNATISFIMHNLIMTYTVKKALLFSVTGRSV